jgi:hypothetical protein
VPNHDTTVKSAIHMQMKAMIGPANGIVTSIVSSHAGGALRVHIGVPSIAGLVISRPPTRAKNSQSAKSCRRQNRERCDRPLLQFEIGGIRRWTGHSPLIRRKPDRLDGEDGRGPFEVASLCVAQCFNRLMP